MAEEIIAANRMDAETFKGRGQSIIEHLNRGMVLRDDIAFLKDAIAQGLFLFAEKESVYLQLEDAKRKVGVLEAERSSLVGKCRDFARSLLGFKGIGIESSETDDEREAREANEEIFSECPLANGHDDEGYLCGYTGKTCESPHACLPCRLHDEWKQLRKEGKV